MSTRTARGRGVFATAMVAVLLGGCSGGGSVSAPGGGQPFSGVRRAANTTTATFRVTIPAAGSIRNLRARHISSNTRAISVQANEDAPLVVNVTAGKTEYTLVVPGRAGENTFTVKLWSAPDGTGAVLAQKTMTVTLLEGQDNPVTMTLTGVVATVQLIPETTTPARNVKQDIPLQVNLLDAGSEVIIGPADKAITLSGPGALSPATATTVTGQGSFGFADGPAATAQFAVPAGLAVDAEGNVYVADAGSNTVRKVDAAGAVSTLASSTPFKTPRGVAVDGEGNVYVADTGNNLIRKIDVLGNVTTVAGGSTLGTADGPAATAGFALPYGLAVDAQGNLYVANTGGNTLRRIDAGGNVTTLASTGGFTADPATPAAFSIPYAVAVSSDGTLYVADTGNNRIQKVAPDGTISTLASSATIGTTDGASGTALLAVPHGVAVNGQGTVLISDTAVGNVRQIDAAGAVTTLAGTGTPGFADGPVTAAQFQNPYGLAVDSFGTVYMADGANSRIRRVTLVSLVLSASVVQDSSTPIFIHYDGGDIPATQICASGEGVAQVCTMITPQ